MKYDVVIVGSGPNGLSAALALAQRGLSVLVLEANSTIGGGARTAEIMLPGFQHDLCSSIHPMAASSPFFRSLPLESHGVEWLRPSISFAHPFDDGTDAAMMQSFDDAVQTLGEDGDRYRAVIGPFLARSDAFFSEILRPAHIPRNPWMLLRFGLLALHSSASLGSRFRTEAAQALVAGPAAHGGVPLTKAMSSALGVVMLVAGHAHGWPVAKGGSQSIADALSNHLRSLGGSIEVNRRVESLAGLPEARAWVFDVTPRQLLRIAGDALPSFYRARLNRFRYGPGVFKIDYALGEAIPWRGESCRRTATVHVGGTAKEIAQAEAQVAHGEHPARPFVIVAQPTVTDPSRTPAGKHAAWAYCHVPNASTVDMTERIEDQIERFAPGFRDCVLARKVTSPQQLEQENANLVGGDIAGGLTDWTQLITRPVARLDPYATPNEKIFLCSSSTPPGGGVHGMCGYWAAQSVLHHVFHETRHVGWP